MKLKDKVAIVTGGNRGIGRGIALSLAKEGANVVIAARDLAKSEEVVEEIRSIGRKSFAVKLDVTKWGEVKKTIDETIVRFGQIDIAVNNAGVISVASVDEMEEKDFDFIIDINLKGTFLCCKALIPVMKKQKGGCILNISSIAGKSGFPTLAHYSASKYGVIGFSNALAKEVGEYNINVNVICPGIVRTNMWDLLAEEWKKPGESLEESWNRHLNEIIPMQREQTEDDMGDLAVFLATAKNITGQAINVDGGVMAY